MRVDPFYVYNLSGALDQAQATQENLSQELSSGLRVNSIGQDPVASAENVQFLNSIQQDDSFTQTASLTTGMLQVTDSALGSVVTQLTQALSLATEANNGTLNSSDLQSVSNELAGIRDEVVSLANTSYQGVYIFAGGQSSTSPFSLNSSTTPATVTYSGDSDVNTLQTPNGQSIQLNLPGNQVFLSSTANVLGTLNNLVADYANGGSGSGVSDTSALNDAINYLSQQRVTIDNSITRLKNASSAITDQQTQLTTVQTNLMQADVAQVSSQLSLSESQQTALINVIAALGQGSLFDKL
ncbi:flagellar hook-associated protein FlgL [Acidicapsa dinghuensis]|uniref:Flagellar hook-associated protein FlgL n=1 Tax=Acidicapsa dinghuensis TaxID=2218256 RepID=A0ABW1EGK4_9BACT|nr:flagellar hook-associated protein FlgL [Acidicapsa dinghuensis]